MTSHNISEHEAFRPSIEQCLEIWLASRQAWALLDELDRAVGGSDLLGGALQEIYAIQLRAMEPLRELGVFGPLSEDEETLMKEVAPGSVLARPWLPPPTANGAAG